MSRNVIKVLFFTAMALVFDCPAQTPGDLPVKLKGHQLFVKEESIAAVSKRVRSKSGLQKESAGRRDISELARDFGLGEWIDVGPSSRFTSYWYEREPTAFRLEIEFAGLAAILKAAKAGGLNPEADQIYSAPQPILAAVQKETADLEKIRLVDVPDVGNLSRAEAENKLIESRLVPEAVPQYATGVIANRVIPDSQDPAPKIPVRPGALVRFGVSVQSGDSQQRSGLTTTVSVSLQQKTNDQISCGRGGDSIYRCSIKGTSSSLSSGAYGLLLWVRPVRPPSDVPGWYLARPPGNGIDRVGSDGSWIGIVQLGNAQWPPHEGDTFDVAVSIADADTINKLMAEIGVIVRNQPVGVKYETALGLVFVLGTK